MNRKKETPLQKIKYSKDWMTKIVDDDIRFKLECLSIRKSIKVGGYVNNELNIECNRLHDLLPTFEKIDEIKLINKKTGVITITSKELIDCIDFQTFFFVVQKNRTNIKESNGRPKSNFKEFLEYSTFVKSDTQETNYELIRELKNKGLSDKFLFEFLQDETEAFGYHSVKIGLTSLESFKQALADHANNLKTAKTV